MPFAVVALLGALIFSFPSIALSGDLRVTPIKMIFDQKFKNGIVTVINEGSEAVQVEIKASEWTQDSEGKDQYKDTADIIFFPKILKIEKGEQRAVRAGIKSPPIATEKTYRLFIRELPQAVPETGGAQVRFSVQFALPVFAKPVKEEVNGEIGNLSLGTGRIAFVVKNTGNTHFQMDSILIKGTNTLGLETYSHELQGWYLLAGAERAYSAPVSREICEDTSKFTVKVKSDPLTLNEELDVIKTLCMP